MKSFRNILCVMDAEETSRPAPVLERAVSLAINNQARLTVASVLPPVAAGLGGPDPADFQAALMAERLQALRALTGPCQPRLPVQIQHEVLVGTGFLEIIRAVLRNGHDLLIKSAKNPNLTERLFGSDDMHLLRKCPCPVWLTKAAEKSNYACLLAAVDFDPERPAMAGLNQQILELSGSLALADFAALHFVHVWDAPYEAALQVWNDNPDVVGASYIEGERSRHQAGLDQIGRQLRDHIGAEAYDYLSPYFHLCRGTASTVIPETAERLGADIVIMGTVARTGVAGLFIGNTAEAVLEQLRCAVLAVKPCGFVSPIQAA